MFNHSGSVIHTSQLCLRSCLTSFAKELHAVAPHLSHRGLAARAGAVKQQLGTFTGPAICSCNRVDADCALSHSSQQQRGSC